VLIGSRDATKGAEAVATLQSLPDLKGTLDTVQIDVDSDASVDAAAALVGAKYGRLDALVNNAGINDFSPVRRDNLRRVLATNIVGAASVTEAFLPLLRQSHAAPRRLVFVSSSMGSLAGASDRESPLYRPVATEYRVSKAGLNMLMVQYAHILSLEEGPGPGFKVFAADPGLNATNLTGDADSLRARGAVEPHVGGGIIAATVKGERDADAGRMVGIYGVSPW
jgi:NAD(P)-dependent dehydrogenase (short-subunit alcohol dehydrogenase family)